MSSAGIPENPLRRFSSAVSLVAGDIIESIKTMFSALTKVCRRPLLLWAPNCANTQNVKGSRSIS